MQYYSLFCQFISDIYNDKIIMVILMEINHKDIGFRIGERRRKLNISQKDLAEQIGISSKYLSNIETARQHVTLETLSDLCNALGVTPDYFLLGNFKNDTDTNITDNLKLCSESDKAVIKELVKICAVKNSGSIK